MHIIKQNDRRPVASTVITRGGVIVDLDTAAGVTFKMKRFGRVDLKVNSAAVITDAANGAVEYRWSAGDTDEAGKYFAEYEVLWADSTTETFPSLSHEIVLITSDLDG